MTDKTELELVEEETEEAFPVTHLFAPRWYLNGFPKSGTHLLVSMLLPQARAMPPMQFHPKEWVGTFQFHSWSEEWGDIRRICYSLGHLRPGHYYKGHCGHTPELAGFLWRLGVAHVFIHRDLRDVAVSQAHHILSDKKNWKHPEKDAYQALGGFDEALEAVIVGLETEKTYYPGVVGRWVHYAPWLEEDWVLPVRFRDLRQEPVVWAGRILEYGLWRLADTWGLELIKPGEAFEGVTQEMAESSQNTGDSPTFRKGNVGDWQDVFTERHRRLFKESDTDDWLVKLGYETSADW